MSLTAAEKAAGRRFRDRAQAALLATFTDDPPTFTVPNFVSHYRHSCPGRAGRSTALECKEVYERSPADDGYDVPAGRFAFIWRRGVCQHCGATARSRAGRLVDAHHRAPIR